MPDLVKITRALLSVSDKTGVEAFARSLIAHGVEVVSTGGTARLLQEAGLPVSPIDAITGFPEMMDGRVKTLHPKVHGGLLAIRDHPEHAAAMRAHGIKPIDLLCINLYPFEQTVARPGVSREEAIEQIDIGGPAMVRSGSKNHEYVAVVTDPGQYGPLLAEMEVTEGCTSLDMRKQLAARAFTRTAEYDTAISRYLNAPAQRGVAATTAPGAASPFPPRLQPSLRLLTTLRYGENPHQPAAVYAEGAHTGPSVINARQLHGKELSYNNLNDAAAALELAMALPVDAGAIAACVIKHANPCGVAIASDCLTAVDRAIAGDPLAAFGGIMAVAGVIDASAAERLGGKDIFLEVLIAEDCMPDALAMLQKRWQNLRILATGSLAARAVDADTLALKFIRGGALAQVPDTLAPDPAKWEHKAGPAPSPETLRAAAAIEVMVRAMTSNAIAIGGIDTTGPHSATRLFGGGLGQVDRVTACRIAVEKSGTLAKGAIAVSDAFFPFPDGPMLLVDAGVKTIIHPGGSKRDQETFDLCEKRGVTCMVTGVRRFRH